MRIISPMATGNGAYVVHKTLESRTPGYQVIPYNPYMTLFPPSLILLGRFSRAGLIHTAPDYAFFHLRKNIPLILTFHNYVLDRFMQDYSSTLQNIHYQTDLKIFTKLAVGKANTITAVSRFTANLVRQEMKLPDNIKVIYNGIDHALFTPKKSNHKKQANKINVLFCGNLTRRKGAQWLVPIAERLDRNINIFYTSGLRSSGMLADHSQLQCLGAVPYYKMPAVYQDADILLFPTVREGFGLVAAEAMSCGLPVVATDCSSLPELIDNGKGGFLCPLGDVDAFADKIRLLAENPQLRREMGEYNRAKVEKMFTLDRMVRQYQELFEEVLSKPS
ncbi:MAG: glycosyltransferase family 4 protein [Proteobacteria bacterium]|nr:glycosyltransferase family 4 protein [Pseudomonadota bacterium]